MASIPRVTYSVGQQHERESLSPRGEQRSLLAMGERKAGPATWKEMLVSLHFVARSWGDNAPLDVC